MSSPRKSKKTVYYQKPVAQVQVQETQAKGPKKKRNDIVGEFQKLFVQNETNLAETQSNKTDELYILENISTRSQKSANNEEELLNKVDYNNKSERSTMPASRNQMKRKTKKKYSFIPKTISSEENPYFVTSSQKLNTTKNDNSGRSLTKPCDDSSSNLSYENKSFEFREKRSENFEDEAGGMSDRVFFEMKDDCTPAAENEYEVAQADNKLYEEKEYKKSQNEYLLNEETEHHVIQQDNSNMHQSPRVFCKSEIDLLPVDSKHQYDKDNTKENSASPVGTFISALEVITSKNEEESDFMKNNLTSMEDKPKTANYSLGMSSSIPKGFKLIPGAQLKSEACRKAEGKNKVLNKNIIRSPSYNLISINEIPDPDEFLAITKEYKSNKCETKLRSRSCCEKKSEMNNFFPNIYQSKNSNIHQSNNINFHQSNKIEKPKIINNKKPAEKFMIYVNPSEKQVENQGDLNKINSTKSCIQNFSTDSNSEAQQITEQKYFIKKFDTNDEVSRTQKEKPTEIQATQYATPIQVNARHTPIVPSNNSFHKPKQEIKGNVCNCEIF